MDLLNFLEEKCDLKEWSVTFLNFWSEHFPWRPRKELPGSPTVKGTPAEKDEKGETTAVQGQAVTSGTATEGGDEFKNLERHVVWLFCCDS